MFEEILKEFFGTTKTFDDLFNEVFDNKVNTNDVKDENNHSYFHSVKDKYENGEHISHSEKEIKDGKVIKDVNNCRNIENKENCKCNDNVCQCDKKLYEKKEIEKDCICNDYDTLKGNNKQTVFEKCRKALAEKDEYDTLKDINKTLEQSLRRLENTLAEKDKKNAELESKLAEVTLDKEYLLKKFEEVKNVFNN